VALVGVISGQLQRLPNGDPHAAGEAARVGIVGLPERGDCYVRFYWSAGSSRRQPDDEAAIGTDVRIADHLEPPADARADLEDLLRRDVAAQDATPNDEDATPGTWFGTCESTILAGTAALTIDEVADSVTGLTEASSPYPCRGREHKSPGHVPRVGVGRGRTEFRGVGDRVDAV